MAKISPIEREAAGWRLTTERLIWLSVGLALVLLPHAGRVPAWITGGFAVLAGWRLYAHSRGTEPSRWVTSVLTIAMLPGVYFSYGTLLGRSAGVALLVILAGMKLLETRTLRDAYIVTFLGFFLVITNFLFSQSIPNGLYMFVVVVVLTGTMVSLTLNAGAMTPKGRLKLSLQMLAQALPVMIILFVLFPRISTPLWGLPKDAFSARSGLSDTMSPGQISNLSLSDEVAFRVKFVNRKPDPKELYWRGPVLWNTDGVTWRGRQAGRSIRAMYAEKLGAPLDYEVTLEPHDNRWLFALDVPANVPGGAQMTEDFEVLSVKPVRDRRQYVMRSYPEFHMRRLSLDQQGIALSLPEGKHPQARAMAQGWREELGDDRAIVQRALAYFNQQPFFYTLQPSLLRGDTVDEFLFSTRRGFCEHYSSAFTVLMRAAGIPARVVTGYQGGEYNEVGDYLLVRQRDAHAWTEVWLDDTGWTRVDPTAAVSPNRIEQGMDAVIPPTIGPASLGIAPTGAAEEAWRWLRQRVDAVNNGWNQWVLGYGSQRQERLLDRLGLDAGNYFAISLVLSLSIGLILFAVFWWMARRKGKRDQVVEAYRRFCAELARRGIERRADEGPMDYADRVIRAHPEWQREVLEVTQLYVEVRFGQRADLTSAFDDLVRATLRTGLAAGQRA